jgi:hypothetical protein
MFGLIFVLDGGFSYGYRINLNNLSVKANDLEDE